MKTILLVLVALFVSVMSVPAYMDSSTQNSWNYYYTMFYPSGNLQYWSQQTGALNSYHFTDDAGNVVPSQVAPRSYPADIFTLPVPHNVSLVTNTVGMKKDLPNWLSNPSAPLKTPDQIFVNGQ